MNRRTFLRGLVVLPLAVKLTPEVFSARQAVYVRCSLEEMNAIMLRHILPGLQDTFFAASPFLRYLEQRSPVSMQGAPLVAPFEYSRCE